MMFYLKMFCGVAVVVTGFVSDADAGRRRDCRLWNHGGGRYVCVDNVTSQPCVEYQEVQVEVMVPETTYQTKKITVTEYRRELQDRTVTVYKQVPREVVREVSRTVSEPVTKQKEVTYVTLKPVWEDKEVTYNYCEPVDEEKEGVRKVRRPVWEDVTREYTVQVPKKVWETTTRNVCRWEQVQTTRTVSVDRGHWEVCVVGSTTACVPCGPDGQTQTVCRPITKRVWRPNYVQEEVPCVTYRQVQVPVEVRVCRTVWEPEVRTAVEKVCRYETLEEKYKYTTRRWVPKTGVKTVRVCKQIEETNTRTVDYTEWVTRVETQEIKSTVYDTVPTEKTVQVSVCVPVQVEKEIQVPVTTMVPKTVTRKVPVPVTADCQDCVK